MNLPLKYIHCKHMYVCNIHTLCINMQCTFMLVWHLLICSGQDSATLNSHWLVSDERAHKHGNTTQYSHYRGHYGTANNCGCLFVGIHLPLLTDRKAGGILQVEVGTTNHIRLIKNEATTTWVICNCQSEGKNKNMWGSKRKVITSIAPRYYMCI